MIPKADWPLILESRDIMACLDCNFTTADAILKHAPVIDPAKRRYRQIAKRALIEYLEG